MSKETPIERLLRPRKYDFFISHHQSDTGAEASLLAETLRNQGGYRVFLDVDTHLVGEIGKITRKALEDSRVVIALVGEEFSGRVTDSKDWVRAELQLAEKGRKKILPITVGEASFKALPSDIAFLQSQRVLRFDRSRVTALIDEIQEAAGFIRPSVAPGCTLQVALLVLAIALGSLLLLVMQLGSDLRLETQRKEAEATRAEAAESRAEAEERRAMAAEGRLDELDDKNQELEIEIVKLKAQAEMSELERSRESSDE